MLKSLNFIITGEPRLNCASCEERVVRALRRLDGVRQARADAASQRVELLVDTAMLEPPDVLRHLDLLGYQAQFDPTHDGA